ncbi:seryl-tRNA synthetase [Jannaschia pagri]|uniref:Seryl-tRNA synthetase n=1 Tax=Jannaschia pagri TaxID=2829797 RepID=A0ABQ4NIK7_9RHOB|nr:MULTISPECIES: tryptophan-rich sensory protein [unclassified Jannaschia]GIT89654.1 seryl-tRNA synthetase [Jannaschia sp. AI_61]GIT94238.1 seryl-tRNA synthetase [Jannaschia sp. AI_62]
MRLRALLVLLATVAFAASPLLVPGFGGYEPDQFPVPLDNPPVQPAGYAFSIWGIIYLWLLVSAAYGLWKRAESPQWDAPRFPLLLSLGVGAIWLPVAVLSPLWATALIWVMLVGALGALLRSPAADRYLLRGAIGLYAGWLTAASAVSVGLITAGWGVPPFGPEGWAIAALTLGLAIAAWILSRVPSPAYGAAIVWALIAVTVQNGATTTGLFAAAAAALVTGLTLYRLRAARV